MAADIPRSARRTGRTARRLASHPWLLAAERAGYVARGVLYGLMGLLALGVALGIGGRPLDQRGGLVFLADNGLGRAVLVAFIVSLAGYALWGLVRAVFDPLRRGSDPTGLAQRLGYLWSGFSYAVLVVFALQLFLGGSRADAGADPVQDAVAGILRQPAGGWLTVGAALVAAGCGLAQFVEAYRAGFRRDLQRWEMTPEERRAADLLGRFGLFARGITFLVVGWFLVQAGLHHDPARAHGYGGAFVFLLDQPFGRWLLAFTAAGFVALGLHSFACARWVRLLGAR
jgi:Domain of Unknown Function (DUF1206)